MRCASCGSQNGQIELKTRACQRDGVYGLCIVCDEALGGEGRDGPWTPNLDIADLIVESNRSIKLRVFLA